MLPFCPWFFFAVHVVTVVAEFRGTPPLNRSPSTALHGTARCSQSKHGEKPTHHSNLDPPHTQRGHILDPLFWNPPDPGWVGGTGSCAESPPSPRKRGRLPATRAGLMAQAAAVVATMGTPLMVKGGGWFATGRIGGGGQQPNLRDRGLTFRCEVSPQQKRDTMVFFGDWDGDERLWCGPYHASLALRWIGWSGFQPKDPLAHRSFSFCRGDRVRG